MVRPAAWVAGWGRGGVLGRLGTELSMQKASSVERPSSQAKGLVRKWTLPWPMV